ncbi:MAG: PIN domain-containing protein [Acidobacteria bacterium]|nr:PIN domain-containing protein [Acidobacteriota bacterium]
MLLDTDVLIDVALDRRPHSEASTELLERIERSSRRVFVAWHSLSNFYYLVTSERGARDARDFIAELIRFVAVAPADTATLRYAISVPMTDFEDAMQVAAARACGAEHIVTRNVRDFRLSPIPAVTPREALARLF